MLAPSRALQKKLPPGQLRRYLEGMPTADIVNDLSGVATHRTTWLSTAPTYLNQTDNRIRPSISPKGSRDAFWGLSSSALSHPSRPGDPHQDPTSSSIAGYGQGHSGALSVHHRIYGSWSKGPHQPMVFRRAVSPTAPWEAVGADCATQVMEACREQHVTQERRERRRGAKNENEDAPTGRGSSNMKAAWSWIPVTVPTTTSAGSQKSEHAAAAVSPGWWRFCDRDLYRSLFFERAPNNSSESRSPTTQTTPTTSAATETMPCGAAAALPLRRHASRAFTLPIPIPFVPQWLQWYGADHSTMHVLLLHPTTTTTTDSNTTASSESIRTPGGDDETSSSPLRSEPSESTKTSLVKKPSAATTTQRTATELPKFTVPSHRYSPRTGPVPPWATEVTPKRTTFLEDDWKLGQSLDPELPSQARSILATPWHSQLRDVGVVDPTRHSSSSPPSTDKKKPEEDFVHDSDTIFLFLECVVLRVFVPDEAKEMVAEANRRRLSQQRQEGFQPTMYDQPTTLESTHDIRIEPGDAVLLPRSWRYRVLPVIGAALRSTSRVEKNGDSGGGGVGGGWSRMSDSLGKQHFSSAVDRHRSTATTLLPLSPMQRLLERLKGTPPMSDDDNAGDAVANAVPCAVRLEAWKPFPRLDDEQRALYMAAAYNNGGLPLQRFYEEGGNERTPNYT